MMKKCVVYTRVSTEMQVDGYSLSAQMTVLEEFAKNNNFEIVERYQDAGKSGKDIKNRPEFRHMLSDISDHVIEVDYVLVFKLSRFGRSALDTLSSLKTLQENNTELICVKDNIDTSAPIGKLLLAILACISEMERENILVQSMEGKKEKARQGKWNGGHAPYGYRIGEDDVLYVVEEERPVIEMIFRLYTDKGWGCQKIAAYLNDMGIEKNTHGYKNKLDIWTTNTIRNIVASEVYCGMITYGKHVKRRNEDGSDTIGLADEYMLEKGLHEGIISEEMWQKTREIRELRRERHEKSIRSNGRASLLSGILKCPVCGTSMHMSVYRNKKGDEYYYYRCEHSKKLMGKRCNYFKHLRQDELDGQVFQAVSMMVDYSQFAEEVHNRLIQEIDMEQLELQIEMAKKTLKNTRNSKIRLEMDIDDLSYDTPHYEKKRKDLERRLDDLYDREEEQENLLEGLEVRYENVRENKIKEDTVYDMLRNFTMLYDKFSDKEKKKFYNLLIERIDLYEEPLDNGQRVKSILFKFPLTNKNGESGKAYDTENLLNIEVEVPKLDMKPTKPVTYKQMIEYVKEKYGVTIYKDYITDVKSDYGLETRQKPEHQKKRRHCTKEAEKYIVDALKHFGLL